MDVVAWLPFPNTVFWLDTVITHPAAPSYNASSATQDGFAAKTAANRKLQRYGPAVTPCSMETWGRLDDTFHHFLTQLAAIAQAGDHLRGLPKTSYLRKWYALIGCTVHRSIARALEAAHTPHQKAHLPPNTPPLAPILHDMPATELPDNIFQDTREAIFAAFPTTPDDMPSTHTTNQALHTTVGHRQPDSVRTLTSPTDLPPPTTSPYIPSMRSTASQSGSLSSTPESSTGHLATRTDQLTFSILTPTATANHRTKHRPKRSVSFAEPIVSFSPLPSPSPVVALDFSSVASSPSHSPLAVAADTHMQHQ